MPLHSGADSSNTRHGGATVGRTEFCFATGIIFGLEGRGRRGRRGAHRRWWKGPWRNRRSLHPIAQHLPGRHVDDRPNALPGLVSHDARSVPVWLAIEMSSTRSIREGRRLKKSSLKGTVKLWCDHCATFGVFDLRRLQPTSVKLRFPRLP